MLRLWTQILKIVLLLSHIFMTFEINMVYKKGSTPHIDRINISISIPSSWECTRCVLTHYSTVKQNSFIYLVSFGSDYSSQSQPWIVDPRNKLQWNLNRSVMPFTIKYIIIEIRCVVFTSFCIPCLFQMSKKYVTADFKNYGHHISLWEAVSVRSTISICTTHNTV